MVLVATRVRAVLIAALAGALILAVTGASRSAATGPWMSPNQSPDLRADELIARMMLDEKIQLLHGVSNGSYIGYVAPIPGWAFRRRR
jgi:beta-glucosidase